MLRGRAGGTMAARPKLECPAHAVLAALPFAPPTSLFLFSGLPQCSQTFAAYYCFSRFNSTSIEYYAYGLDESKKGGQAGGAGTAGCTQPARQAVPGGGACWSSTHAAILPLVLGFFAPYSPMPRRPIALPLGLLDAPPLWPGSTLPQHYGRLTAMPHDIIPTVLQPSR